MSLRIWLCGRENTVIIFQSHSHDPVLYIRAASVYNLIEPDSLPTHLFLSGLLNLLLCYHYYNS